MPLIGVDKGEENKKKEEERDGYYFFNPEILIHDSRFTIHDSRFTIHDSRFRISRKQAGCRNVPEEKFEVRFEKRMTK